MKALIASLLICTASSALAATTAAKTDTTFHPDDYMRYGLLAGANGLDYMTTHQGLALGCKEVMLPQFITTSDARLATFKSLETVAEIAVSAAFIWSGHRNAARWADWTIIAATLLVDASNERAIHTQEATHSTLVQQ